MYNVYWLRMEGRMRGRIDVIWKRRIYLIQHFRTIRDMRLLMFFLIIHYIQSDSYLNCVYICMNS